MSNSNSSGGAYKVLFVCTGNICRSPMAHLFAQNYSAQRGREMLVQSASTMGLLDKPADHKAIAVMGEVFLDLTSHLSQPLTEDLVVWADYVLVMEYRHAHHIRKNHPVVGEKLMMLGSFGGFNEIEDPIGSWKYKFRKTRDQLSHCVEGFVDRLPPVKQSGQKLSI